MKELGTRGKLLLGVAVGSIAEPLKVFTSTPLDCKKTPFLSIKVHITLDRIGYLIYDTILLGLCVSGGKIFLEESCGTKCEI